MNINTIITFALTFTLLGCQHSKKNNSDNISNSPNRVYALDTLIIRIADYTGDGVLDTEKIHIMGESFYSPLSWKYNLWSNGQIIYHYEASYDSKSDSFFYNPGYVGNCSDYTSCKKSFFYEELGMITLDSTKYDIGILDYIMDEGLPFIMDSCGVTDKKEAERIVDSIASVIHNTKPKLYAHLESPVQEGSTMIFVKRFNRFVPIYHE